jgi:mono/diheme cytochrome c family protein
MSKKIEGGLQVLVLASAAALAALWPTHDRLAPAQDNPPAAGVEQKAVGHETGSTAKGRVAFRIYCASCHGAAAQGDGPVGKYLKIPPTDLTRLAAGNKGEFPTERAYAVIDGRSAAVPSHGPRDMPVWGLSFQPLGNDSSQESEVRGRILDLIAFLKSVQATAK